MKLRRLLPPALIASLLALTAFARVTTSSATSGHHDAADSYCPTGLCSFMSAATNPTVATAATCVVSGEKLGSMGKPIQYVHKEAGKPDRIIQLCCATCIDDFKENPAKYLAKLDAAKKP